MTEPIINLASQIYIKLNGAVVQDTVMSSLAEIVIDQHCHLPDMFTIRLHDPNLDFVDRGPFNLTQEVEVGAYAGTGEPIALIEGEVTALEPTFAPGGIAELVVRGYDQSHRLYRQKKSRAYVNVKDSDLASEIASAANLRAEVDPTTVIYDHIYQHNQSDLSFLLERAWRIGYECFVKKGTLYFQKPEADEKATVTLPWGENNLTLYSRMTLAEQVDEVIVRGWDVDKQQAIVGQAQNGALYPMIGEAKNGSEWANSFGLGRLIIADHPVKSQTEADLMAEARLNEVSGAFLEVEGEVFRRPDVQAGEIVELSKLGTRFSGRYLVTNATHVYTPARGLETHFTVRGLRNGLLTEQLSNRNPIVPWPGVVTAVVTNNKDPQQWGRVKVKFAWLTEDAESDWVRIVSPNPGAVAIPAVGDEVLVAFEHGSFNAPFIVGTLWNGQQTPPFVSTSRNTDEDKSLTRTWQSRNGHRFVMQDKRGEEQIEIVTKSGHKIILDDAQQKMEIITHGGSQIILDDSNGRVHIKSSGNVELQANGNMDLTANGDMNLKANGQVNVRGSLINLN